MSDNPGMRWDIEETRFVIGYAARDGAAAVSTPTLMETEKAVHAVRTAIEGPDTIVHENRW
jgi:hypothetical protein